MRLYIFLMAMFLLPVSAHAGDRCEPHESIAEVVAGKGNLLSGPLSVEELEKDKSIVIRETGQALPFGYSNKAWLKMKAAMQPGDQIYFLLHRDGIFRVTWHILFRDGCIVRRMLNAIS